MEAAVKPLEVLLLFVVSTEAGPARLQELLPFCVSFVWLCSELLCLASWGGFVFVLLFFVPIISVE